MPVIPVLLLPARAKGTDANKQRLTALISEWKKRIPQVMESTKVPGLSMAVLLDGKFFWRGAFGVTDAASGTAVDTSTVFEAASMSKPVFAYAVMKLAEKGVLDLDAPLTRYTRDRFVTGDPRLDLVTARRVLSHSTGFPNWRSSKEPLGISFSPGERYKYSGEGYYYLQSVVTHLVGHENRAICQGGYEGDLEVCATDIAAFLKARILTPLGMNSSSYIRRDVPDKRLARGHDQNGVPKERGAWKETDPARYAAAGGLLTTPTDYAKFLMEVMNPKPPDEFRLAKTSLDEMLRPQIEVSATDQYRISWGLGWRIARTGRRVLTGHGGDNPGFHCLAEMSLQDRSGFVIMTNGDGGVELLRQFAPDVSRAVHSVE